MTPWTYARPTYNSPARLLREAAAYLSAHAKSTREADKARQMNRLSKKLIKKIETNEKL